MKKNQQSILLNDFFEKLLSLVSIPWVLAAIVSTIIILAFIRFPAYRISTDVDLAVSKLYDRKCRTYADFDQDNNPDKVFFDNSDCNLACIAINFKSGKVLQWNFRGEFPMTYSSFFSLRNDERKGLSLHLFVKSNDSLFLYRITEFDSVRYNEPPVFISKLGTRNGYSDLTIVQPRWVDMNNDGNKELVFGLNSGFGKWPRKLFIYSYERNELLSMKDNMHYLSKYFIVDLDNDKQLEILPDGYASDNISDSLYRFHDRSCWMMVLNNKLEFIFEPIEFPGKYNNLNPFLVKSKNGTSELYASYGQQVSGNAIRKVFRFDINGNYSLKDSLRCDIEGVSLQREDGDIYVIVKKDDELFTYTNNGFEKLGTTFLFTEIVMMPDYSYSYDFDGDGNKEIMTYSAKSGELAIFRDDTQSPAIIPWNLSPDYSISVVKGMNYPLVYIYSSSKSGLIHYSKNPHHTFRYLYFLAIYLSVLGFIFLVIYIQKAQLSKKAAIIKNLEELQLKLTKNRLDSHFTLNILNSIIIAISQGKKDEANHYLHQFAKMYRFLLLKAEKVDIPVESELDFIDSYLQLENFRFCNRFEIIKEIDERVDLSIPVPKLLIQTLVENSIKHGLFHKETDARLFIRVYNQHNHVVIEVEDNGIGREAAAKFSKESSGLGFKMTYQILELYQKTNGVKISCKIIDLVDKQNNPSGTLVRLSIPVSLKLS